MRKLYLWLYALAFFTAFSSCGLIWDDGGYEEAPHFSTFLILDEITLENLLGDGDNVYHKDTIKLVNKFGNMDGGYIIVSRDMNIGLVAQPEWQYVGGIDKFKKQYPNGLDTTLYLYLHQNDIDTLRYTISYDNSNDPHGDFYHNGKLSSIFNESNRYYYITKTKQEQELVNHKKN